MSSSDFTVQLNLAKGLYFNDVTFFRGPTDPHPPPVSSRVTFFRYPPSPPVIVQTMTNIFSAPLTVRCVNIFLIYTLKFEI